MCTSTSTCRWPISPYANAGWWFLEASAEWAAHQVAELEGLTGGIPEFKYYHRLEKVFGDPSAALTTFKYPEGIPTGEADDNARSYGSFVFVEYLQARFDSGASDGFVLGVYEALRDPGADSTMEVLTDRLAAEGDSWATVLPGYWAAAYVLSSTAPAEAGVNFVDPDVDAWRDGLKYAVAEDGAIEVDGDAFSPLERPYRRIHDGITLTTDVPETSTLPAELNPGGSAFVDVSLQHYIEGRVQPYVWVDPEGFESGDTERLRGTWIIYDTRGYPNVCQRDGVPEVVTSEFEDGVDFEGNALAEWDTPVVLDERCPTATLMLSHVDPRVEDEDQVPMHFTLELKDSSVFEGDDLDGDFGNGGFTLLDGYDSVRDLVVQPDGKVLVLLDRYEDGEIGLARFKADGDLDTSFGTEGIIGYSEGTDLLGFGLGYRDPPGSANEQIVVGATGDDMATGGSVLKVLAFDDSGALLDAADFSGSTGLRAEDFQVDSSGRPVFVANTVDWSSGVVLRWDPGDYELDSSFGLGGLVAVSAGEGSTRLRGLAEVDGTYVVAGLSNYSNTAWVLNSATGALTGTHLLDAPCGDATDIAAAPGYGFYLSRTLVFDGVFEWGYIARYSAAGVLDESWNGGCETASIPAPDGILTTDTSGRPYSVTFRTSSDGVLRSEVLQHVPPDMADGWSGVKADTGDSGLRIQVAGPQAIGTEGERLVVAGKSSTGVFIGRISRDVDGY